MYSRFIAKAQRNVLRVAPVFLTTHESFLWVNYSIGYQLTIFYVQVHPPSTIRVCPVT